MQSQPGSNDIDALVIMGGPGSQLPDEPWIEATQSLVRTLDAAAMPVLGICLGLKLWPTLLAAKLVPWKPGTSLVWADSLDPGRTRRPVVRWLGLVSCATAPPW